jgi:protein-tyrosine phosphatase
MVILPVRIARRSMATRSRLRNQFRRFTRDPGHAMSTNGQPALHGAADVHFHLLPGLDDGPADIADSLELARAALGDGTSTVVATPHVRSDFVTDVAVLAEVLAEVRHALARERIELEVHGGAELGHDVVGRLRQAELEAVAQGPPEARWLLLESPFEGFGPDFHLAARELRERGFGVVLAHPERSADAQLDAGAGLRRELAAGSFAQVNALSITGNHGRSAEWAAFRLVASRRATLVASDAHGPTRPPALRAAHRRILEWGADPGAAFELVHAAPRRLLELGLPAAPALAA